VKISRIKNTPQVGKEKIMYYEIRPPYDYDECDGFIDDQTPEQKKIESCSYWMESILERIYGHENIDMEMLQYDLEEISHLLGVKMPKASMNIEARTYIAKEA
jgi:hypothetical protein